MARFLKKIANEVLKNKTELIVVFSILFTPFINFMATNINVLDVDFSSPFIFTVTSYFVVIFFIYSIKKITKYRLINIIASVTFLWVLLFYYEFIYQFVVELLPNLNNGNNIIALLIIMLIFLSSFVFFRFSLILKIYTFLTIAILIISIIFFILSFLNETYANNTNKDTVSTRHAPTTLFENIKPTSLRNIYYIITDGLGSERGLISGGVPTYAIKKLKNTLLNEGFYIVNSTSSYNITQFSIQSIFEMDYPLKAGDEIHYGRRNFFPYTVSLPGSPNTTLQNTLTHLGYDNLYWFGGKFAKCTDASNLDCPPKTGTLPLVYKILLNISKDNALAVYLEKSIYPRSLYILLGLISSDRYYGDSPIDDLTDFLSTGNSLKGEDSFFFVHQLTPHPPYVNQQCEPIHGTGKESWNEPKYKNDYNSSILCLNKKLIKLIQLINQKDKEAIVVIQGDHGSNFREKKLKFKELPKEYFIERFSNFNALRLPNECNKHLYDNIGSVNSIRLVTACAAKISPVLINDKSFYGGYDLNKVIDISETLYLQLNQLDSK